VRLYSGLIKRRVILNLAVGVVQSDNSSFNVESSGRKAPGEPCGREDAISESVRNPGFSIILKP